MPNELHNQVEKFKKSFIRLSRFLDQWVDKIKSQAIPDDIRRAAWLVWGRYSITIRTLNKICDPCFLPDIWLIGRSCLEYEATLKGIIDDPNIANDYLAFPDKAKAYYAWLLERMGHIDKLAHLETELISRFGENWRNNKAITWSRTSDLVEKYGGSASRCCYALWSHFTHCSVVASNFLENTAPSLDSLDTTIIVIYGGYVETTHDFLEFVWGPIVTIDSDKCKNDFLDVMRNWI